MLFNSICFDIIKNGILAIKERHMKKIASILLIITLIFQLVVVHMKKNLETEKK